MGGPASRPQPSGHRPVLTGIVLAGGRSRRYGKNKALEKLDGIPLIERVCRVLMEVADHVIISTNTPEAFDYLGLPMFPDEFPGFGPLGGIHSGLRSMDGRAGFIVACDMPFLKLDLMRHMAMLCCVDTDAVVPRIGRMIEPLHAIYTKECIPSIVRAIKMGEKQIFSFFPDVRVRYVEEPEIRRFDPNLDAFININRPGEFDITAARKSIELKRLKIESPGS